MTADDAITGASAIELSRRIATRDVSCRAVMEAFLARIARLNPHVNAIVRLRDEDALLGEADDADAALARGERRGWMHGFPQAPKDIAAVAGMATTSGSPLLVDHVPAVDAIVVERLRRAGAIFIGRTNVPEFGLGSHTYNTIHGTTGNAYDPAWTAGGSSGGAAVALALALLPVADGSDFMGSLRNPAAFNNVFGFRPSFGRVPHGPADEVFWLQLGTEGPMARDVADLAMLLSVQAGFNARVPLSIRDDPAVFAQPLDHDARGTRVGWLGDYDGYLPMEAGVLPRCEEALRRLEAIGCTVEHARPAFAPERLWDTWLAMRSFSTAARLAPLHADPAKRARMKPEAVWEVERGLAMTARDVERAMRDRSAWYLALHALFDRFDVLALPTAQVFPFDKTLDWPKAIAGRAMDTYHRWMEVVIGPTLAGLPTLNVPAGFDNAGRPMGLSLVGPAQADVAVLRLGHAYEAAIGDWLARRSPLAG